VTAGSFPPALSTAKVVLVAVRDGQLPAALGELETAGLAAGAVVLHASGAIDPRASLDRLRARGHAVGTFHPLVPFVDPARAPSLLRGAWIGIDGDPDALLVARALADRLGAHVLPIPPSDRATYHAAAAMAANFPAVLAAVSGRLLERSGVDPATARGAVRHLMAATVSNLAEADAPVALTGPVSRGDADTVARHADALASDADALTIYRALTRAAVPLAASQGVDPEPLRRILALLDVSSCH
jgi:predicted short-subunit dehydrogenase-like oxidoreductase (DUF2520 family)